VVQMLCDYEWPGNVRELRNVIERAALLANDDVITEHEILLEPQQPESELSDADEFDSDTAVLEVPSAALSGRSERDRIVRALEACGGNQTRAAKMLGMSRRTLINRLEQFNLPRPKKGGASGGCRARWRLRRAALVDASHREAAPEGPIESRSAPSRVGLL